MLSLFLALGLSATTSAHGIHDDHDAEGLKGTGIFEAQLQKHPRAGLLPRHARADGGVDLRVAKALGPKGYNKLRLSVVGPPAADYGFDFDYRQPFQFRWLASYDLGTPNESCGAGVYYTATVKYDGDCLNLCNADGDKCQYYTFYTAGKCELSNSCDTTSTSSCTTYFKYQTNWLYSTIVDAVDGLNNFTIGGQDITINLPSAGAGTTGVIWSDPCFSSRWISCAWANAWNTFNRSYTMLNALAQDPDLHFFEILGDNFYDQDSRLSKAMFDQFSLQAKSKILHVVAGNHDLWVCGSPSCGDQYDQWGYGTMQWYGQDVVASVLGAENGFLDFSINPDTTQDWTTFNNNYTNFIWYHSVGNLGFLGYNGGATLAQTKPQLEQACSFFAQEQPGFIILLGHWNGDGMGCASDMTVPSIYSTLLKIEACAAFSDRIKYFDGHTHCNELQQKGPDGTVDEVGFMIGAHGMSGCSQYGFVYLDSTGSSLKVWYFEERNSNQDNYQNILDCVNKNNGNAGACTALATLWLEQDLKSGRILKQGRLREL